MTAIDRFQQAESQFHTAAQEWLRRRAALTREHPSQDMLALAATNLRDASFALREALRGLEESRLISGGLLRKPTSPVRCPYCQARPCYRHYYSVIPRIVKQAWVGAQRNRCAICAGGGPFVLDHNHESGLIRGALCFSCNVYVGKAEAGQRSIPEAHTYLTTQTPVYHRFHKED